MATAISFNTARSHVISLLQASRTAYATTTDGSKRQFASDTEIDDTIFEVDGEVCTLIANTLQHPFQSTFVLTSSALSSGAALPARNGMILRVTGWNGQGSVVVTDMDGATDVITATAHGFTTGQKVQFTTTGVLGGGLSAGVDYYVIYVTANTFKVATTPYNAAQGTAIDLNATEPVNTTVSPAYIDQIKAISADEVKEVNNVPAIFKYDTTANSLTPFYFIEGDIIYSTAYYSKVIYTDYTKTSSPQAPEPYMWAVVAGAVSRLLKDGGDVQGASYYAQIYDGHKQEIASRATVIPQFHSA